MIRRTQTSRRSALQVFGGALLLPALARAEEPGGVKEPAQPPAGPWPSTQKIEKDTETLLATLRKVPLANGDAPDAIARPALASKKVRK
ncbi:MAG: hypothetical protein JST92_04005 [Deltaproteobacteria bacterium]|nr:hypothetical protein [Deltaproteobacteria bacterium]